MKQKQNAQYSSRLNDEIQIVSARAGVFDLDFFRVFFCDYFLNRMKKKLEKKKIIVIHVKVLRSVSIECERLFD